jgi:hypothetical protein
MLWMWFGNLGTWHVKRSAVSISAGAEVFFLGVPEETCSSRI